MLSFCFGKYLPTQSDFPIFMIKQKILRNKDELFVEYYVHLPEQETAKFTINIS